ncbi:MAG: alcohol dehydrogenase catalytic domain-containing protein [Myxococcales bacterium]|nr:alcohol dehydrogenase catalytic domain-containing protein [Myxococcales bacterium]
MWSLTLEPEPTLNSDTPVPERLPGEARIRVRQAGVCDTDLQLARGYMGFKGIPGHEFVGEVVEAESEQLMGKRVVGDINAGCGECADCSSEHLSGHHCSRRSVLGILGRSGAFAEQLCLPERCLVTVPEGVRDEAAVFAEPLAAALHVLDELPEGFSTEATMAAPAVVLGDGKLGLLIAAALAGSGLHVVLIGHHENKLAMLPQLCEPSRVRGHLERELDEDPKLTEALSAAPLVVEATGSANALGRAFELVRPRGTVVLKTTVADPLSLDLAPVVINELRLVGSRCGDMRRAVEVLERGDVVPLPLIQARYPLHEADKALEHAGRKGVLKVLIDHLAS